LLPFQQWYLQKDAVEKSHFNQALILKIEQSVTESLLQQAMDQILDHHDALRFRYSNTAGEWRQEYGDFKAAIFTEDLQMVTADSLGTVIEEKANFHQRQLDIENGCMIRIVLFRTATGNKNRLLIVIHHLAVDGVSWRILLEDLETLLAGMSEGQQPSLGQKTSSYRQWFDAIQQHGLSTAVLSQKEYWQNTIQQIEPLPVDKTYQGKISFSNIKNTSVKLNPELTRQLLQEVPRVYHTEINDLLLSALAGTLCNWSGSNKVVIGLEGHGRETIGEGIDTSRTIGWFTSLYPVLLEKGAVTEPGELIKTVKEQLRRVPGRGLGYGILKYINREPALQGAKNWEIVFNYLGQFDNVVNESKWFAGSGDSTGAAVSELYEVSEKLSVNCFVQSGELVLNWSYSGLHYEPATISKLAEKYLSQLETLISHCLEQGLDGQSFTPSDYGLGAEISYVEMDNFLEESFNGKKRKDQVEGIYRLSGLQQGMLFHALYDDEVGAYIEQFTCDLLSPDLQVLTTCWQLVIKNHSVLRSGFYSDVFTIPVQCVYREVDLPIEVLDHRGMNTEQQEAAIAEYLELNRTKGFDFKSAPLMHIGLIQVDDTRFRMLWTFHHILFDGWSMPVLMEEFLSTYDSLSGGTLPKGIEEDRYEDYIRYLERRDKELEQSYWRNYLQGLDESTLLPFIGGTTNSTSVAGKNKLQTLAFDSTISRKIQGFAQRNRLTVNTIMQGVWSLLLHHYTRNDNVAFGVIVSGRPDDLTNVEKRVGMYINTLPLHSVLKDEDTVTEWLQEMQSQQVASRQCQYTPLHEVQAWAGIQGDLFDSILIFENYPVSDVIGAKQWSLGIENIQMHEQTNYPLSIGVVSADKINIGFSYNAAILNDQYVQEISAHFEHVLMQMIEGKANRVSEIKIMPDCEEQHIRLDFNKTASAFSNGKSITALFEEQVLTTPGATALVFESTVLSYRQLNEQSNQLANYLQRLGVGKDMLVPICIERGIKMVVGILGILKAGAAYVPVDPEYPLDRINYMLEDMGAEIVLLSNYVQSKIQLKDRGTLINLDTAWNEIMQEAVTDTKMVTDVNDLVYVIYTSGSTGRPKGVEIEHKGLVNLVFGQVKELGLRAGMSVLQFASFGFDASCSEIFTALLTGSKLVIPRKEDLLSTDAITGLIKKHHIDLVTLPPSYQVLIKDSLKYIPILISAGEPLNGALAKETQSQGVRVFNAYGPTENTVCVSMTDQPVLEDGTVTIGKPIGNVEVYIVDKAVNIVPVGVPGELCVGGTQVARGYLNRPELSSEKFIKNPFAADGNARLYKTGDLARWLPDGNIQYLGRLDEQVKVAGHRIECGEIEAVLAQHPLIEDAVVVVNETKDDKQLVAFYKESKRVELWPSIAEFFIYDDIVYRSMYEHTTRNDKYKAALDKVVPGKTVLEIGPGPEAVLSRLCLDAGAKHVYTVEILEETYIKAKKRIESLGLTDKITLIHGDIRNITIPEKVDYCVSEIVGSIAGSEGAAVLIDLAKKFLKDPSHMIPSRSITRIAAISLDESLFDYGFSDVAMYYAEKIAADLGADFEFRLCLKNLPEENMISTDDVFEDLDYSGELTYEHTHEITLSITKDSIFNGFYVWMDLFLDEEVHLDIMKDPASWLPVYFPVSYPGVAVKKGDNIKGVIRRKLSDNNLNPDFFVETQLITSAGEKTALNFTSYHYKTPETKSPFFQKLFENGQLKKLQVPDASILRQYLSQFLPDFMIPTAYISQEIMPLTANGKLDRKALIKKEFELTSRQPYVAPRNELEEKLTAIWQELLNVKRVGVFDNFFELGGHSLLAMRMVSYIERNLLITIPIRVLFQFTSINDLSKYLEIQEKNTESGENTNTYQFLDV